jgi:phthalate 4,5-dioxygenase oxygenase subunit
MLSTEENEYLTETGPGTPTGSFMREYWLPAMISTELPGPDCDPVRVMMLGEQLIGFRDTEGRPGLIANLCPHRGASLFFGRNEESGLRCVYHGWKFDVDGNCVDMPNEPAESNFKSRIKASAYPVKEHGGIIWVYMGSREVPPPLPGIEAAAYDEGEYRVQATLRECNWLQALEGDIDTVHAAFLHGGQYRPEYYPEGTFNYYESSQRFARFLALDTEYGCLYGAGRPAGPGRTYWRVGQFMFPFWTQPAPGLLGYKILSTCWVPLDDHHTLSYTITVPSRDSYNPKNPGPPPGQGGFLPNTTDWFGRFRTAANLENDFLLDRDAQRKMLKYSGVQNIMAEDHAVQASMGPVLDRTIEHLGTSDLMILRVRRRMIEAIQEWSEHKSPPPALDTPDVYGIRCGGVFLPEDQDLMEGIEELVKPFVDHPELDPAIVGGVKYLDLSKR